jgi:hypothetical protein
MIKGVSKHLFDNAEAGNCPNRDHYKSARSITLLPRFSALQIDIAGQIKEYRLAFPRKHMALNSLAVCAAVFANTLRNGDIVSFKGSARNNDLNALITYLRGCMPELIS